MPNTSRLTFHMLGTEKTMDFEIAPENVPSILEAVGTVRRLDVKKPKGDRTTINLYYVTFVEINDAMNRQAPGVALDVLLY